MEQGPRANCTGWEDAPQMTPRHWQPKLTDFQRRLRYAVRKAAFILGLVALGAALVLADHYGVFGRAPLSDVQKYDGKTFLVVRVVDGDTFDVNIPDGKDDRTRVRLWGVDTPETVKPNTPVQHFGPEASALTRKATLDKQVRLELDHQKTRDRYGRLLAFVYLPDANDAMLNRVLVEEGYGYADPRYEHQHKSEFNHLQHQAMDTPRGLWNGLDPNDLPYYLKGRINLPASAGARR
jgi:micrococcal nuclease